MKVLTIGPLRIGVPHDALKLSETITGQTPSLLKPSDSSQAMNWKLSMENNTSKKITRLKKEKKNYLQFGEISSFQIPHLNNTLYLDFFQTLLIEISFPRSSQSLGKIRIIPGGKKMNWELFRDRAWHTILALISKKESAIVYHAAAWKDNESKQGILMPGASGEGKTTAFLQACSQGAQAIADDLVLKHQGKLYGIPTLVGIWKGKKKEWHSREDLNLKWTDGILHSQTKFVRPTSIKNLQAYQFEG